VPLSDPDRENVSSRGLTDKIRSPCVTPADEMIRTKKSVNLPTARDMIFQYLGGAKVDMLG